MPTTSISRPSFSQHFVYFGNDEWAACPTVRAVVVGEKISFCAYVGGAPKISATAAMPKTETSRELGIEPLSVGTSRAFSGRCHTVGLVPEHELAMCEAQEQMTADSIGREQDEKREHARNV